MEKTHRWIERQIVKLVVRRLLNASCRLTIDRSEEGGSDRQPVLDASDASIDEIMACDWETLFVSDNGWVQFTYGNDGWDVISDYTTNLELALAPVNKIAVNEDIEALIDAIAKAEGR